MDARGGEDGQLAQWARNHLGHLYRRPVRVERAPEPAAVRAAEPPPRPSEPDVSLLPAAPTDGHEDEEPQRNRSDADVGTPGLAAAPA